MKTFKDLKLKGKAKQKVEEWLKEWLQHFTDIADGARETVERYDLENLDFFYYTDCRDYLSKNPESKGIEDAKLIRKRKHAIEYRLLFKKLLGEELGRKRPCSHCGNDDRWIDSLGDGTGHFLYCPKCHMTVIVTYPCGYDTCINQTIGQLYSKGFSLVDQGFPMYTCRDCGKVGRSMFTFSSDQCNSCYQRQSLGESTPTNEKNCCKSKKCGGNCKCGHQ